MKIIDSNIIIYSANPAFQYLDSLVTDPHNVVSLITLVETIGYQSLKPSDEIYFDGIFNILRIIEVDRVIVNKAIEIRQQQRIKLGDSIVAATALVHGFEVYTRNVADFKKIPGLTVVNLI